jgi:hypothetical protein
VISGGRFRSLQRVAYEAFNPLTDVPSLKAWYRADTTTNAGGFVSQLTDKSGNGFHFVQATGSKQPALNVADANMGGRDSISLDGTDDAVTLAAPGFGSMSGLTFYIVTRSVIGTTSGRFFAIGASGTANSLIAIAVGSGFNAPSALYANPGGVFTSRRCDAAAGTQAFYASAVPVVWSFTYDAAAAAANAFAVRTRLATVVASNAGSLATPANVGALIAAFGGESGTSSYEGFTMSECIVADAIHSTDTMRRIELYLAGYHGIL